MFRGSNPHATVALFCAFGHLSVLRAFGFRAGIRRDSAFSRSFARAVRCRAAPWRPSFVEFSMLFPMTRSDLLIRQSCSQLFLMTHTGNEAFLRFPRLILALFSMRNTQKSDCLLIVGLAPVLFLLRCDAACWPTPRCSADQPEPRGPGRAA